MFCDDGMVIFMHNYSRIASTVGSMSEYADYLGIKFTFVYAYKDMLPQNNPCETYNSSHLECNSSVQSFVFVLHFSVLLYVSLNIRYN